MNQTPDPRASEVADAEHELARLNARIEGMRAVLVRLLQDVVVAESRVGSSEAALLVEANEQLVVSALRAQTDAVTTALALDDMSQSAQLDPLTQLPNRALLRDRFEHAIANAKRHGTRTALLFLDLNDFKQINDKFGHAAGDQALKLAAQCLQVSVRETDTVSRHGGDEFVILLAEVSQAADAATIAEKLISALGTHRHIDEHVVRLIPSIGISMYPDDGEDPDTLINRADAAMYLAKRYEAGGIVFHGEKPRVERSLQPPTLDSLRQRLVYYARTMAEHEHRLAQLQEANEQLVLAALGVQEPQVAAEPVQRRDRVPGRGVRASRAINWQRSASRR